MDPCVPPLMAGHLSENELKRIAAFANTPKYERNPDLLVPSEDD